MGFVVRAPRFLATVGLVAMLTAAAAAQSQPGQVRIDNFAKVNATYYRGAQPLGQDYADLAALGVRTVIDLTSNDARPEERSNVERNGMHYVRIPMTTHQPPTAAELDAFLGIASDKANQPVYVHCVGGRHRTGVMTAVYRMTFDGLTGAMAFKEMKQFKYGADMLHPEFKEFVQRYDPKARTVLAANTSS
jgi:tyrosine-protein phosphatase SIW14